MSYKLDRVSSELKKEISIIIRDRLSNPNISPITTITAVTVSKDLRCSTIYISGIGDECKTVNALNSAAGFIRRELAATCRDMRTVPNLVFKVDDAAIYGRKIDKILKEIEHESNS